MRLNGLGAPDERTLILLETVDAVVTEDKKEPQQGGYCFHCGKYSHYKAQFRRLRKERCYTTNPNHAETNQTDPQKPKCDTCPKIHKTENSWDGPNAINNPRKKKREFTISTSKISEQPVPNYVLPATKLRSPRLRFGEKVDARAYTIKDPLIGM